MSLNITSPNFIGAPLPKIPPMPAPMEMEATNSQKLLDELAIAAQFQMMLPSSDMRKAWRQRMNDCREELGNRLKPQGGI